MKSSTWNDLKYVSDLFKQKEGDCHLRIRIYIQLIIGKSKLVTSEGKAFTKVATE